MSQPARPHSALVLLGLGALLLLWIRSSRRSQHAAASAPERHSRHSGDHGLQFSRNDVLDRLKSHSTTHYAGLYNVMKGVTLAAVGLSLFNILGGPLPFDRVLLLFVAILSVLISYNGEAIGQAIMHLHPTTFDVVLPMALTVTLVLVVGIPGVNEDLGDMPVAWFAAFAAWSLMAAVLVFSVASRLDTNLYAPDLHTTVNRYKERMFTDAKSAAAIGVIALFFFIARHTHLPDVGVAEYVFLALASAGILAGLRHHEATRKELRDNLLAVADPA